MQAPAARGGSDDLARFRRLTGVTIVASFILILIGGVVRVSDSGLGCGPAGSGTHGWPLCGGRALPFLETNAVIEFTHRAVAGIVALLILALLWMALRRLSDHRWLVRGSIAAAILVLAQAALGGLTVEKDLHEVLVAAHLGLAMLLLGVLLALRRATEEGSPAVEGAAGARGLRTLAIVASTLVLATIVAGGYVAGTEGEGKANEPVVGAHLACGQQFPGCVGSFMPFGTSSLIDAQLTHRALMYLAAITVLGAAALGAVRRVRTPAFWIAALVLLAQVLLGALNVWLGKHAGLIVAHLTVGTLLWTVVVYATLSLSPAPAARRSGARSSVSEIDAAAAGA
jgi:heme A synthase